MAKHELADIDFTKKCYETELAWLLEINGNKIWIPKAIAEVDFGDKVVTLPMQWAIDKELV